MRVSIHRMNKRLEEVIENPQTPLDHTFFNIFRANIAEQLSSSDRTGLLNRLSELLSTIQQDPSPATSLIDALIESSTFTFDDVLAIRPEVNFLQGLQVNNASINLTTLGLLGKAQTTSSGIAFVANQPSIVAALIRLWLCIKETEVATKCQKILKELLLADAGDEDLEESGDLSRSLLWRRIFRDQDVYGLIFSICSFKNPQGLPPDDQLSKARKTLAQTRLLDLLPALKHAKPLWSSQYHDLERQYGVEQGGLLEFAVLYMIDDKDDLLVHMSFLDFCSSYLNASKIFGR